MSDLWKAATRRNEFEPSRLAYVRFTGSDISGPKFLARIVTLTEEADAPPLPTDNPDIKRHVIHIEGVADPVHVLRRDREDGTLGDLRIAKSGADKDVRQATRQMADTAKRAAAAQRARPRPTAPAQDLEVANAAKAAHHAAYVVWRKRKKEFGDLFAACQQQPGNKKLTGPTLLLLVHELTDQAVAQSTGVEGIERFDIELPGVQGSIGVLRRLHDDGTLADLHLAPPDAQLGHMLDSMSKEAKKSQTKLNPELPRAKKQQPPEIVRLQSLWLTLGQSLDGQSKAYFDHQRASNASFQDSSQLFVRHLNDLCDKAPGVVVDEAHHITRHEVTPDGSDEPIVLLRRNDENGLASMRHVGEGRTDQADAIKSIIKQVRRQAAIAKRPAVAAASDTPPAKRARAVDTPSADAPAYASKVKSANQLRQALALMLENKRNGQPVLLTGVEARTGVSESALRNWLDHDGGLRRSMNSLVKLEGYFEVRDDLHELFSALGQQESAEALPQAVSVGLLAKVLKARVENPLAVTSKWLAELTGSNAGVLHRYIDARTGTLRSSDEWLRHMPGYDEHRDSLCDALRDLGHVERADGLPRPETSGERFLRSVQEDIYPLAAAAEAMRADPSLTASTAAQLVHEAPEMAEMVDLFVGPGGVARSRAEIEAARPDLELDRLSGLDSLLQQLDPSSAVGRMSHVLMPKMGPQVAKLFVVDAAGAAPSAGRPKLSDIYANSPGLVMGPRSYAAERPRQTLRWLSTVLKAEFPNATEIQCYFDPKKKVVWVSSNHEKVNAQIEDFLSSGGLAQIIDDSATESHKSRVGRHRSKLGKMLADPSRQSSDEARELLKAMSAGRFRVPVETFHLDGKAIDLHAERRIKEAFARVTGQPLNHKLLAGTMRPCGICAKDLGLPPTVRRGPFWLSRAGQAFYNARDVVEENVDKSIGSFASVTNAKLSVNYNTDSDSEDELVTADALPKWGSQGKRSASGAAPGGASSSSAAGPIARQRTAPK